MEIPVSAMPSFLKADVLKERKKLLEDGKIDENVKDDLFHLFSEGLQLRLLDFAEGLKKGQVHSSGDDFELPEYKEFEAPKDYKDKVEAIRLAFTSENYRPGRPSETLSEAKDTWETPFIRKKDKKEAEREEIVSAFTSRPVIEETK